MAQAVLAHRGPRRSRLRRRTDYSTRRLRFASASSQRGANLANHCWVTSASGAGSSEYRHARPSWTATTRPASRSIRRWRETAGRLMVGNAAARSPAVITGVTRRSSSTARRVGSASASKTASGGDEDGKRVEVVRVPAALEPRQILGRVTTEQVVAVVEELDQRPAGDRRQQDRHLRRRCPLASCPVRTDPALLEGQFAARVVDQHLTA